MTRESAEHVNTRAHTHTRMYIPDEKPEREENSRIRLDRTRCDDANAQANFTQHSPFKLPSGGGSGDDGDGGGSGGSGSGLNLDERLGGDSSSTGRLSSFRYAPIKHARLLPLLRSPLVLVLLLLLLLHSSSFLPRRDVKRRSAAPHGSNDILVGLLERAFPAVYVRACVYMYI